MAEKQIAETPTPDEFDATTIDALWPLLADQAARGVLSDDALFHLLATADNLSAEGDWERAWRVLDVAADGARASGSQRWLAEADIHRGILHYRRGDVRDAIDAWEEAYGRFAAIDHLEGMASCLTNLGAARKAAGEQARAADDLQRAVTLYRDLKAANGEAAALTNLGLLHRDHGETAEAIRCFERARELAVALGDLDGQAACTGNLGIIEVTRGNVARAIALQEDALALSRRTGNRRASYYQ